MFLCVSFPVFSPITFKPFEKFSLSLRIYAIGDTEENHKNVIHEKQLQDLNYRTVCKCQICCNEL
jgi:hypothetical protein